MIGELNLSELADLIVEQVSVGTMIKTEGTVDPLGFLTILPMNFYKEKLCIQQIKTFLLKRAPNKGIKGKLQELFNQTHKSLGLLIQDRMINLPQELINPLHQAIYDDISWAKKNERDLHLRAAFKFDNIILVSRCWKDATSKTEWNKQQSEQARQGKKKKKLKTDNLILSNSSNSLFFRYEEQFYADKSFLQFPYSVNSHETEYGGIPQSRLVCVFSANKVPSILHSINNFMWGISLA